MPINVFDAAFEYEIRFQFDGGNQVVRNRLVIKNNESGATAYDQTIDSYRLSVMLPANTLQNGTTYNIYAQVFDIQGTTTTSATILFKCLTTPVWKFTNVEVGDVIRTSNYDFTLEYSQEQGSLLDSYRVTLLNAEHVEIWNSGVLHTPITPVKVDGMSNSATYFIRARGNTVDGFILDTGEIRFSVSYEQSALSQLLNLENLPYEGAVHISSGIIGLWGRHIPPGQDKYYDGTWIDLKKDGDSVVFDSGFSLTGDYELEFIGFGFSQNKSILYAGTELAGYNLFWRQRPFLEDDGVTINTYKFVELRSSQFPRYIVFSNKILVDATTQYDILDGGTYKVPNTDITDGGSYTSPATDIIDGGTFTRETYHVRVTRLNGLYKVQLAQLI